MGIGLAAERLGVAVPRAHGGHAHRRHRRPTSGAGSSATRPTCSSPRPSRSTCMLTSSARETLAQRRGGDHRRDPRPGRHQAGRAPGPQPRAARGAVRAAAAAHRPVGHAAPARRDRPLPAAAHRGGRRPAAAPPVTDRRRRHPQAARGRGRRPRRGHGRPRRAGRRSRASGPAAACRRATQHLARHPPAPARAGAGPPLHHHLRATPAAWPSGWPPASTSWPPTARTGPPRPRAGLPRPGRELVKAHHGSLAREQRLQSSRTSSSAGELRGLVATSSLELGIDMGAVDLVIQVESPGAVSPGPAAHRPGRPPGGRAQPGQALPQAPRRPARGGGRGASACTTGLIEQTRYLRNPLDVLAQQIVAMCALDEWPVDELAALVRRAAPFAELSRRRAGQRARPAGRAATRPTSSPSCGPASCGTASTAPLRGRAGAQRLAVTSGGTIPDRGLFGVFLPDGTRVGELDEEMVYESRPGETFLLGRQHLAHRGHHPRAGRRHARRRASRARCRSGTATARAARSSWAGRSARSCARSAAAGADAAARAAARATTGSTAGRRATWWPTSTSRPRPPASCPTTAPSWSSASATRSATGGCACCRPFGAPGPRAVGHGHRAPAGRALGHRRSR